MKPATPFFLRRELNLGFDSSIEIPNFSVNKVSPYCWATLTLTNDDLDALCNIALMSRGSYTQNHVQYSTTTSIFFDEVFDAVRKLNEDYFQFELWGINSGLHFIFLDENTSISNWQQVRSTKTSCNKIIGFIGLSNPDAGTGGELEVQGPEQNQTFDYQRGVIYLMPSWSFFRFTPLTAGVRLFTYFSVFGPSFK